MEIVQIFLNTIMYLVLLMFFGLILYNLDGLKSEIKSVKEILIQSQEKISLNEPLKES